MSMGPNAFASTRSRVTWAVCAAVACGLFLLVAPSGWASYAGTLDPSFGSGGAAISQPVTGQRSLADALAVQPDGKVLVGGYGTGGADAATAPAIGIVERLTSGGKPDTTFGRGGSVALSDVAAIAPSSVPHDQKGSPVRLKLLLLADGRILVLGGSLIRLNSDGARDGTFGSSGVASLPTGFAPAGMAVAPDGAIVVVGNTTVGDRTAGMLVRLTAGGQLDTTFGAQGSVTLPPLSDDQGQAIAPTDYRGVTVAADGSITAAGIGNPTPTTYYLLGLVARLMPSGALDSSFGQGGQAFAQIDSFEPNTITSQPDGTAVVGALSCGGYGSGCFPIAARVDAHGVSAEQGANSCDNCEDVGTLERLADGGFLHARSDGELSHLNADLSIDTTFGTGDAGADVYGHSETALVAAPPGVSFEGVAATQPDGKILLAGSGNTPAGQQDMVVARVFGFSAPPEPTVSIPRQLLSSTRQGIAAKIDCGGFVSCDGTGVLRHGAVVLARGAFAIAAGHLAAIVMRPTRDGLRELRGHRRNATLTVSPQKGTARSHPVTVRPLASTIPPPSGRFGGLHPLASAVTSFDSDGRRYVTFTTVARIETLDTLTQRRFSVALPAGCQTLAPRPALSFPMALVRCDGDSVEHVINLTTGTSRRLGLSNPGGIGRVWIGPVSARGPCPNSVACQQYLNWHTGATRTIRTAPKPPATFPQIRARDLDSPRLPIIRPCEPFAPATVPYGSTDPGPGAYDRPFIIFGTAVSASIAQPYSNEPGLNLGRCGQTTRKTLDATALQPGDPLDQLGSGSVTWSSPNSATTSLYEIATAHTTRWAAPGAFKDLQSPAAIVHTRHAAIVATATHQTCQGAPACTTNAWTLYQARRR